MSTPQGGKSDAKPGAVRITGKSATAGGKPSTTSTGKATPGASSAGTGKAPSDSGARKATPGTGGPRKATTGGPGRPTPSGGGKGGNRRPIVPITVAKQRNWMPIIIGAVVAVFALAIVGYGVYNSHQNGLGWQQRADKIKGIVDYRETNPQMLTYTSHQTGVINYPMHPPVGGTHNPQWQRCAGDVYPAAIADEHAVHSMEHGAVWITYNPSLPASQVQQLAAKVTGNDFMLMSPYPGLDAPISLQTWGFQLKVNSATDPRINQFITDLREISSNEPGAVCSSGQYITATGTTPHDIDGTAPASAPPSTVPTSPAAPSASASK